ncbi:VOC family protein [Cryobacterium sp. Y50]|uniref:VOC family protein n=1 Tax=Cryobacterium sp. Y50 TaxID=2048286 RepID=UPI001E402690|nr:VOC family protein [Cryobacterium sp. Y50]
MGNINARRASRVGQLPTKYFGRFWAEALDWGTSSEGPGVTNVEPLGFVLPNPVAVSVDVVSVPDPETLKYRAHLEVATTPAAHQSELVARLQEPRQIYQDTGPIAAVVVSCADIRAMARF